VSTQSPTDFNQFVEFVSKNSGCRLGGSILKEAQPSSDHSVLFACTVIALTVAGLIVFGRLSLFDAVRNHNLWSGIVMVNEAEEGGGNGFERFTDLSLGCYILPG
jgi:hypothetical protein